MMMATLEVPADQLSLPREQRQFPFRWASEAERLEVRQAAGEAICGVEGMIYKAVTKVVARAGFGREDMADVMQDIRLLLLTHSLSRYDSWRRPKVKVSTFLQTCIRWATRDFVRRLVRKRAKANFLPLDDLALYAKDETHDLLVERLADHIHRHPELIDVHGATLLNIPPGQTDATTAATLGLTKAGLICARYRSRRRAVELLHHAQDNLHTRGEVP